MAEAKTTPADAKSAADVLIEMQLKEKLEKSINPLAVTEESVDGKTETDSGTVIAARRVYANGSVLESYS